MSKGFFITGIGTGVGKTLASAVICETLNADYWKPVQCGNLQQRDSILVKNLLSNPFSKIHPEKYLLKDPLSPHAAAENQGVQIQMNEFELPETKNRLIVEGAGGLLVPLNNDREYMWQLAKQFQLPVILVADFYLGSINHTLLSLHFLKNNNLHPAAIIWSGEINPQSKKVIENQFSIPSFNIPFLSKTTPETVKTASEAIIPFLKQIS